MKERLNQLVSALGISGRKFCQAIGKSDGFVRNVKGDVSVTVISNILTAFPQVNIWWLVRGEGDMFVDDDPPKSDYSVMVSDNEESTYCSGDSMQKLCRSLMNDNQELRRENKELRDLLMEQLAKNERLLIENTQLKVQAAFATKR